MNKPLGQVPGHHPIAAERLRLSVVVPTFNEHDNVEPLLQRLETSLAGIAWEVVFVDDDSPDRTWEVVRRIAERDPRVRCLRRIGRRGLSGACIEGILAAGAPTVAVLDADLQHDDSRLASMLALIESDAADLVVGSRFVAGGSAEGLDRRRTGASTAASMLARRLLGIEVGDLMSGFFMIRRERFEEHAPSLSAQGFKILLDLLATSRGRLRVVEIPYAFGARLTGDSKLDSQVVLDFFGLLLAKLTRDIVPLRFLLFAIIGATGLAVHLLALDLFLSLTPISFAWSQAAAALVAMTSNFALNNRLTYRDQRLRGFALLRGLVVFYLVCAVGLIANVGVAFWLYGEHAIWWFAGAAGALMGAVWNYSASTVLVWRAR
ncbi:glycosyltransferase family 2 protein [Xanthobacteraceae bacterium Astr-EGSB]|uniref:glycosyltransferase family 2 protein n=1 Tax=Astrobacterium formosum TaxID=3069710 RepID=UPI0027B5E4FE|nr:glycosyltransferase family 2 protein [Xanthobacteraceae bacterium Astr-EGSB]